MKFCLSMISTLKFLFSNYLGLQRMNMLISQGHYELRIDLEDWEGETRYAKYTVLHLGDARKKFELTVDGYTGNAGTT